MSISKQKSFLCHLLILILTINEISANEKLPFLLNTQKVAENTIIDENIKTKIHNGDGLHFTTVLPKTSDDEELADLLITKSEKKEVTEPVIDGNEFLSIIGGRTEVTTIETTESSNLVTTNQSNNTDIDDNASTTIPTTTVTTPHTDKPPAEDSVVSNYTLCEDMLYDDVNEEKRYYLRNLIDGKSPLGVSNTNPDTNFTMESVDAEPTNDTALTIVWKPKEGYEIHWFIIKWFKTDELVGACRTNNQTFNYTITHLIPCTTYSIHVLPATNDTIGKALLAKKRTALIVDNDSLKLRVTDRGDSWIKIAWNLNSNSECIKQNNITYCNSKNCQVVESPDTNRNITDLIPCTDYNITLTIYGEENKAYGSANIDNSTTFMKPQAPLKGWTTVENNSLTVFWTPSIGASCIKNYRVTLNRYNTADDIIKNSTSEISIKFDNLRTCSIYNVTVVPVDTNGDDSNSERFMSNRTAAPIPDSPVYKSEDPSTHSITIEWSMQLDEFNNCEEIHIETRCNSTKVLGHGYEGLNGSAVTTINETTGEIALLEITNLSPYTNYSCYSIAFNSRGNSSKSRVEQLQTKEDVPPPPSISVHDIKDKGFKLTWEAPKYIPGHIAIFEVNFTWYYKFTPPSGCGDKTYFTKNFFLPGNSTVFLYSDASPFSQYNATIRARTRGGWGNYSGAQDFKTWPGAPGPVQNLIFQKRKNPFDSNILEAFLSWGLPCYINAAKIDQFNITAIGHRDNSAPHNFTDFITMPSDSCPNETCIRNLSLKEEYSYVFHVAGRVKDHSGLGEVVKTSGTFPAGIPPEPSINYTNQISIDPFKARRTTSTASILLPLFPNTRGDIKCYAIIVAKRGYNNGTFSRIDKNPEEGLEDGTASWNESKQQNFEIPYKAASFCENSYRSYIVDYGKLKAVKFVIGEESDACVELSSKKHNRLYAKPYCNGPLNPDMWYDVRMRAFTRGGYRDSRAFTVKTNATIQVPIVVGSVLGILLLGILITMMLLIRKCSVQAVMRRFLHSDMPGSPVPTPFNRRKFIAHCQQLADNPGKLSNEFQLLQTLSVDLQMPTNAACLQANRKKNRYTDILPYDFSRVKLEIVDNDPNTDYINASFIKGFSGDEEYVACQGPKEETTYDFWRMIDQYNVKLIIMLTQLVEKNKEKCHQYYPTIRETFTYENLSIRCSMELDYRTYTQRTLILQKDDEKRTVIHLHFKDWPDHDVPEDCDPMINFCQIMRRHIAVNRGLAVIHCSAGIGRTGTLIAIDILLQHIKDNRKLDVFGTVYRLRHHRINMVQRESQYAYIYNCIKQVLNNPYFSKSYKPPSVDPITDNNLNNKKKENSMTNLVSSLETLKKDSLSSSIQSAEEILKSSTSITLSSSPSSSTETHNNNNNNNKLKNCLLLIKGHQYSKSTSAIYSHIADNQIVRYNTLNYPVNNIDNSNSNEEPTSSSTISPSSSSSSSSKELNNDNVKFKSFPALNRYFKSASRINDDPTVTQKLLDTSL